MVLGFSDIVSGCISSIPQNACLLGHFMKEVQEEGTRVAHYIRNDIYEVICRCKDRTYRILFSEEGKHNHILLALEGFPKKTRFVTERSSNHA